MLVSIIIPVYNMEKYLHNCIDSVLKQTYSKIEIILVDDGSKDNCGKICDEYAIKDERIKVFHKTNGGLSSARNFGVARASGKYVAFVDADDFVAPDFIETLVCLCKKHNADIVQCNRCYNNEDKGEELDHEKVYSNIEAQGLLYGKDYIPTVNSTCKLINKKIFDKIKFNEGRIHEDEFIIHRMLYLANKLVYINKRMYIINRSENSITRSKFSLKNLDSIYALEDRIQFYKSIKLKKFKALTIYIYILTLKKNICLIKENFPQSKEIIRGLKRKLFKSYFAAIVSTRLSAKRKIILFLKLLGVL